MSLPVDWVRAYTNPVDPWVTVEEIPNDEGGGFLVGPGSEIFSELQPPLPLGN